MKRRTKVKITILGDEETRKKQYKYIKDEQYEQYNALNLCMTLKHMNNVFEKYNSGAESKLNSQIKKLEEKLNKCNEELKSDKLKETKKKKLEETRDICVSEIKERRKEFEEKAQHRTSIDKDFKQMYVDDIYMAVQNQVNFKHKDNMSLVTQRVKADYSTAMANGLAKGTRSLTTYKRSFPLLTRGGNLKLEYDEETKDFTINWVQGIRFKVVFGSKENKVSIINTKHTLNKIISGEWKLCDSQMNFDRGNRLILDLTLDIGEPKKFDFIENRVVGVDIGMKIPAYCALNDIDYIKKGIGCIEDFLRVRLQMQKRYKATQRQLKQVKGGKGRNKKLKNLETLKEKEKNFARTYNHFLSHNIVKFAKDNKASQINLELLSMKETQDKTVLRNWGYYQLQQQIEYKAEEIGIKVRYVDPYHTSQICSECNHYEEGQREKQDKFICKKCGIELNADYNASRNISKSTNYITKKEESIYYKIKQEVLKADEPKVDKKVKKTSNNTININETAIFGEQIALTLE